MAFAWLYERLTGMLDEESKDRVDALLGMPGAQARVDARRRESLSMIDLEVG